MQKQIIKRTLEEEAGKKKDIEKRHVQQVLELADKETGKRISLPYKLTAEKSYQELYIGREEKQKKGVRKGRLVQEKLKDLLNITEKIVSKSLIMIE